MSILEQIEEVQDHLAEYRNRAERLAKEAKALRDVLSKLEHDVIGSGPGEIVQIAEKFKPENPVTKPAS